MYLHNNHVYKTRPYAHQIAAFDMSKDAAAFALLMEMGTGKSKVIIDNAAYLYGKGAINALLLVCPNGVHRNWIINELPAHLPDHIACVSAYWAATPKKAERQQLDALFDVEHSDKLKVFAMNVEAFSSPKGPAIAERFLRAYKTMMVVDESGDIANISAKRTKSIIKVGKYAVYRRILNGTPITQGPLDAFAQFYFLDKCILNHNSYYAFRNHYAVWERKSNYKTGRAYQELKSYQNLDELRAKIQAYSYRALKEDCLDLPDKVYEKRYVELSPEQRKLYKEAASKIRVFFENESLVGTITSTIALTKLLRLQQITGGYVTVEEAGNIAPLPDAPENVTRVAEIVPPEKNPRIQEVLHIARECTGKIIIWARFIREIEALVKVLRSTFGARSAVAYYGAVKNEERVMNIESFQHDPEVRFFIGQQRSAGMGVTLTAATTVVYYSNDFSLRMRLQSEDRAHRIGQSSKVLYIDIEAVSTIDKKIVNTLREKKNLADAITDGRIIDWI